jgi:MGT family glycosyltransferase
MMDVLLELRRRGHRVVVQTLAGDKGRVEAAGLEHRAISPAIEALELRDWEGSNPLQQFRISIDTWLERAPHEVEDLRKTVSELDADFLLIDANTLGASAFAEQSGLPWALHMPYCLPTPSKDAPVFGPGFAPPRSALGRARDSFVRWVMARALSGQVRRLNEFRRGLGAGEVGTFEEIYSTPPTILYRTAEPFEYPRSDWAPNVEQLGPGLWAPEGELPEWVLELPEPRVLVSISTEAQNDGAIVETAIRALGGEPGSVICTTSAESPEQFDAGSPNVRVVKFLPHAELMPHLACVVSHGGMGTVQRALAAGVPLVVVPWGRDQSETAQRTVVAGAGTRLNPGRLSADRLRAAVREAMTMNDGARAVAEGFDRAGGGSRGADLIEGELSGRVSASAA